MPHPVEMSHPAGQSPPAHVAARAAQRNGQLAGGDAAGLQILPEPVEQSQTFPVRMPGRLHPGREAVRPLPVPCPAFGRNVRTFLQAEFEKERLVLVHAAEGVLEAADRQVFYRETVRAVAHRHGLRASLAPKPFIDQAGNGAHVHFSLWDEAGRRSRMYDPRGRYGVSALGYQFIAGVLEHLPALLALTCPSVNSYRRLQPHFWSSAYTAWGPDNREAAVRVPSTFPSDRAGSTNAELKASKPRSEAKAVPAENSDSADAALLKKRAAGGRSGR